MVTAARRAAFRILQEVGRGRRLDRAFEVGMRDEDPGDRGWVQELTYGVSRLRGRLDHLLDLHVERGVASVSPPLLVLLRMGAYQLLRMESVPPYAAVSQTAGQARALAGKGGAALVNGVLRALARAGGDRSRFPDPASDPAGYLSDWGSHPRWLVERWLARWDFDAVARLVEANNRVPALHLRPIGVPLADAVRALATAGIVAEPGPPGSGTLRLGPGTDPRKALGAVPSVVQDPAAALVTAWVGVRPGDRVADLCAAPGGKGLGLAGLGARVIGLDPSLPRLRRMARAVERLGLPVGLVAARAEASPVREADVVLVDAPCSGTGTLARHPDGRWRITPATFRGLAAVQDRILDGAAHVVAPGGLLVYATCTLEPEENEERIEAFLLRHREFIVEGGDAGTAAGIPDEVQDGPFLRVLPQVTGTDGAFAARLRRTRGIVQDGPKQAVEERRWT